VIDVDIKSHYGPPCNHIKFSVWEKQRMTDEKTRYKIYYNRDLSKPDGQSSIILSVEGQTDIDTLKLFRELKKEVGFVVGREK